MGGAWVARVFPAVRTESAVAGDAESLGLLQRHGFPAERVATAEPLSVLDGHTVLANVVASPARGMVLVDWAGAGRGPRAWPLAFLLYAEAAKNPPRAGLVVSGFRRRVTLEPDEIERIPAMMRVRPAVLAAWSLCLGRCSAEQAMRATVNARQVAETVGPRVVEAFRARLA
jgi:Ser/Thr protein kinase RdoA (MazF antagonist)